MLKSIYTHVIVTKKYNTETKALRAYYGPMSANHGHPPALEIEEKPPTKDMKIRRIAP